MTRYTIKLLDARGGLGALVARDGANDDDVIDSTERLEHPHGIEVWEGLRLVARVPPISVWGLRLPL